MERVKQTKPVPDLMNCNMPLPRCRIVAAAGCHARHGVAVDPAPISIELLAALLHDTRERALPAEADAQIGEEVDVKRIVAPTACGGAPGDVAFKVGDADSGFLVEALAEDVIYDTRNVDEVQLEAVLEIG